MFFYSRGLNGHVMSTFLITHYPRSCFLKIKKPVHTASSKQKTESQQPADLIIFPQMNIWGGSALFFFFLSVCSTGRKQLYTLAPYSYRQGDMERSSLLLKISSKEIHRKKPQKINKTRPLILIRLQQEHIFILLFYLLTFYGVTELPAEL